MRWPRDLFARVAQAAAGLGAQVVDVVGRLRGELGVRVGIWLGSVLSMVLVALLFVVQVFHIPSPSMVPTLEVGDMVVVTKYSYGIRPYSALNNTAIGRNWALLGRSPKRGDIVVVRSPTAGLGSNNALVVKRVVGLPGDDIRLRDGLLEIRTQPVKTQLIGPATSTSEPQIARGGPGFYLREHFPSGLTTRPRAAQGHIITDLGPRRGDNFGPFTVPNGMLFLMGDNRDNSVDSRARQLGVVPFDNLVGKAQFVLMSWRPRQGIGSAGGPPGFALRLDRFLRPLR